MTSVEALPAGRICPACGYDLRGTAGGNCPECGLPADKVPSGHIAWEHRRQLGWARSFLKTTKDATFRQKQLAGAMVGPVDLRSAKAYRRSVLFIAASSALAVQLAILLTVQWDEHKVQSGLEKIPQAYLKEICLLEITGLRVVLGMPIGLLVMLCIGSATAPWFRSPAQAKPTQAKAMTISFYTCAPLLWLTLPAAVVGLLIVLPKAESRLPKAVYGGVELYSRLVIEICGILLPVLIVAAPIRTCVHIWHEGYLRAAGKAGVIAAQWIFAAVIGLIAVPVLIGFVFLMIRSFWI